jgi:hypothetical protein
MHDLEQKIRLTEELAEIILQPINGMWRQDEILACGDHDSLQLQEQGQSVFNLLFAS